MGAGSSPTDPKSKASLNDLLMQVIANSFILFLLCHYDPQVRIGVLFASAISLLAWAVGHFTRDKDKYDCLFFYLGTTIIAIIFRSRFGHMINFVVCALFNIYKVARQGHSSNKEMLTDIKHQFARTYIAFDWQQIFPLYLFQ